MKRFLLVILLSTVSLTHAKEKSPQVSELQTHWIPLFSVSQRFNAFYMENEDKNIATTVTTIDMQLFRYSMGFGGFRGYFQAPLMQGMDTYVGFGGFGGYYIFDNRKYINNNVIGSTMAIISEGYFLLGEKGSHIGAGGIEFRYTHNFHQFFAINVGANVSIGSITENNSISLLVAYGGFIGFSF